MVESWVELKGEKFRNEFLGKKITGKRSKKKGKKGRKKKRKASKLKL